MYDLLFNISSIIPYELKLILKLRKKFGSAKLPVVIAYTRATNLEESEQTKKGINEFLNMSFFLDGSQIPNPH